MDTGEVEHLHAICKVLDDLGIPYQPETSKSRGWHIFIFCDQIPADKLRRFGLWVIQVGQMEGIVNEFFPKQVKVTKTGNALWLPLYGIDSSESALVNGRCRPIDISGKVFNQEEALENIRLFNEREMDEILEMCSLPELPGL